MKKRDKRIEETGRQFKDNEYTYSQILQLDYI